MRDDRGGGEVMRSSRRLLRDQRVEVVEELKVLLPGAIMTGEMTLIKPGRRLLRSGSCQGSPVMIYSLRSSLIHAKYAKRRKNNNNITSLFEM